MTPPARYMIVTDKGEVLAETYYKLTSIEFVKNLKLTTKENLNIILIEDLDNFRKKVKRSLINRSPS